LIWPAGPMASQLSNWGKFTHHGVEWPMKTKKARTEKQCIGLPMG